jgi:NifU-like protein involved in Fe-S cluster formation
MANLQAFSGLHAYPSRIGCALLPWHCLLAALDGEKKVLP